MFQQKTEGSFDPRRHVKLLRRTERLLKSKDVQRLTGYSRTSLWRLEKLGKFPKRITLSRNAVRWHESEVRAWMLGIWPEHDPRGAE